MSIYMSIGGVSSFKFEGEVTKIYSQTCHKGSPFRQKKIGLIRQMTSYKRFNSFESIYDRTRKGRHFNTGEFLIEVTLQVGLTNIYLCEIC